MLFSAICYLIYYKVTNKVKNKNKIKEKKYFNLKLNFQFSNYTIGDKTGENWKLIKLNKTLKICLFTYLLFIFSNRHIYPLTKKNKECIPNDDKL